MPPSDDLRAELQVRKAQRDTLAAWFLRHPHEVVTAEQLIGVVGPNYRSRISECETQLKMNIPNVPLYREWVNKRGKTCRQRLIGGYKFIPPVPTRWPVSEAPTTNNDWRLT